MRFEQGLDNQTFKRMQPLRKRFSLLSIMFWPAVFAYMQPKRHHQVKGAQENKGLQGVSLLSSLRKLFVCPFARALKTCSTFVFPDKDDVT